MKRVHILVEGYTEDEFVRSILAPYFLKKEILITANIVATKIVENGPNHKGGGDFKKIKENLSSLLQDSSVSLVTMFFDFYGFPKLTSEKSAPLSKQEPLLTLQQKERRIREEINHERFLPFLILHEFETLLFVRPGLSARELLFDEKYLLDAKKGLSPEEINDGTETSPSKRVERIFEMLGRTYNKAIDGVYALLEVPLEDMMKECPHFGSWIKRIEELCTEDRKRVPNEWFS